MSNIELLPSGSYRYTKQIDGRRIRITFDHDPSETEIMLSVADRLRDNAPIKSDKLPFVVASKQYINLKRNVLSPATIREYGRTSGRLSDDFINLDVYKITQADIQAEINRLSLGHTPKTVKNYHAFIASVIKTFNPDLRINTTLPQEIRKEPYIPTDEEVRRFLEYIKAERESYYVLVFLAMCGLRRSEILAIKPSDLDGNTLNISRALVMNENKQWVEKTTKTARSTRSIVIPSDIADTIREQGYAFKGNPSGIKKVIDTACKRLNINHFTLHKLRHYFASKLISENTDLITVMSLGGWNSMSMLERNYAHALDEKKKDAMKLLTDSVVGVRGSF